MADGKSIVFDPMPPRRVRRPRPTLSTDVLLVLVVRWMNVHKLSMPPLSTNANQNPFGIGIHKGELAMDVNPFSKGFSFSLVALMALRVCGQSSRPTAGAIRW